MRIYSPSFFVSSFLMIKSFSAAAAGSDDDWDGGRGLEIPCLLLLHCFPFHCTIAMGMMLKRKIRPAISPPEPDPPSEDNMLGYQKGPVVYSQK